MMKQYRAAALGSAALAIAIILALRYYWLLSHPFSITNIKEGQQLSGDADVLVHVTGRITWVEFGIDGLTYTAQHTNTYGNDHQAMFNVPTYLFKNGPHTLQIKAYSTIYDQRHVVFQNAKHPG